HRPVEIERLDRDQRLVVIHAERRVITAPRRRMEHRVGRQGPLRIDACRAQFGDGRHDDVAILAPERAAFARMRVEPGDREPRGGNAEIALQRPMRDMPGRHDRRAGQRRDRFAQCQMDRHRYDAQLARRQHHDRRYVGYAVERPGQLAEIFRMAGVPEPGTVQRLLVDRVRDDRRRVARLYLGYSAVDGTYDETCIGRVGTLRLVQAFATDWLS